MNRADAVASQWIDERRIDLIQPFREYRNAPRMQAPVGVCYGSRSPRHQAPRGRNSHDGRLAETAADRRKLPRVHGDVEAAEKYAVGEVRRERSRHRRRGSQFLCW